MSSGRKHGNACGSCLLGSEPFFFPLLTVPWCLQNLWYVAESSRHVDNCPQVHYDSHFNWIPLASKCYNQKLNGIKNLLTLLKTILTILNWRVITILCWFLPYINMDWPYVYMFPPSWASLLPTTPYHPSQIVTEPQFEFPESYSKFPLAIYFIYVSVYVSMLLSPFVSIPPFPSCPLAVTLSLSLCLHLHCCPENRFHQYHLSRFHMYELIYNIWKNLLTLDVF